MSYLIILAMLVLMPIILIVALRVNGAIAFMSLCLGSVLVRYTSSDVGSITSGLSAKTNSVTNQWVNLTLLVAPFVLTALFTRKNVSGNKQLTNLLPAIASGLLFGLLVTPLLSRNLQTHIEQQHIWNTLSNLQTPVILAGAFFSLLFLLVSHRGHREDKHSRH